MLWKVLDVVIDIFITSWKTISIGVGEILEIPKIARLCCERSLNFNTYEPKSVGCV